VVHKLGDLLFASATGDEPGVAAALRASVSVNETDHNGAAALHAAAGALYIYIYI